MLDSIVFGYFGGIFLVFIAICFVLDFFLDGAVNIFAVIGTFLLYSLILFLVLYIPVTIASRINMKGVRKRVNEHMDKVSNVMAAEAVKAYDECRKAEEKINPDWKKDLRKDIDKEMRDNGVTGVMHR